MTQHLWDADVEDGFQPLELGLIDVGPMSEIVVVRAKTKKPLKLRVTGVDAEGFFFLINTIEEVKALMEGQSMGDLTFDKIMGFAPKTIGMIIGCGITPRDKFETYQEWVTGVTKNGLKARQLGVGDQTALMSAIFSMTFSEGAGPFVQQLKALTSNLSVPEDQVPGVVGTSATPKPSNNTARSTRSPARSRAVLQTDTIPGRITRGRIHRVN